MRVIFEDRDDAPLVRLYASLYPGMDVQGVGGVENISSALTDELAIAYVDIGIDAPRTRIAFNKLAESGRSVIPVPIPNSEYMYLMLVQKYGQVADDVVVQAALRVVGYEAYNSFHSRTYEKFCKAVTRTALTGCAKLGKGGSRFLRTNCLCDTHALNCTVPGSVNTKATEFVREFPIKWFVESLGSSRKTMGEAVHIINTVIDEWNGILQEPYLKYISERRG